MHAPSAMACASQQHCQLQYSDGCSCDGARRKQSTGSGPSTVSATSRAIRLFIGTDVVAIDSSCPEARAVMEWELLRPFRSWSAPTNNFAKPQKLGATLASYKISSALLRRSCNFEGKLRLAHSIMVLAGFAASQCASRGANLCKNLMEDQAR